jgi:hypothetical protein
MGLVATYFVLLVLLVVLLFVIFLILVILVVVVIRIPVGSTVSSIGTRCGETHA